MRLSQNGGDQDPTNRDPDGYERAHQQTRLSCGAEAKPKGWVKQRILHFPFAFRAVERPSWAATGIVAVGRVHVPYLLSDRRRMAGQVANIDGLQGEFC